MPVAEADHTFRLQRNNARGQQRQHIMAFRPSELDGLPRTCNPCNLSLLCGLHCSRPAILPVDKSRADGDGIVAAMGCDDWWMVGPLPLSRSSQTQPDW